METHGATCIDCHQNLVHEEAPMTDLDASREQRKLVLKEDDWDDWDEEDDDDDDEDY
ncbi:cytochrome c-type protein NapC [Nitrosomonas sp. Nm51]|nr:cytochrome c-type protein NapC [Nitrosomonas sp. Nm51]SER59528.1 cytochrome c-type protein NapC [Nitrosomonas sp. Nm51]